MDATRTCPCNFAKDLRSYDHRSNLPTCFVVHASGCWGLALESFASERALRTNYADLERLSDPARTTATSGRAHHDRAFRGPNSNRGPTPHDLACEHRLVHYPCGLSDAFWRVGDSANRYRATVTNRALQLWSDCGRLEPPVCGGCGALP
jgi:hypothetical protein